MIEPQKICQLNNYLNPMGVHHELLITHTLRSSESKILLSLMQLLQREQSFLGSHGLSCHEPNNLPQTLCVGAVTQHPRGSITGRPVKGQRGLLTPHRLFYFEINTGKEDYLSNLEIIFQVQMQTHIAHLKKLWEEIVRRV